MIDRHGSDRVSEAAMISPLRPALVLVRPQEEGNVGAVARAMANMGLDDLHLVEPAAPLRGSAYAFAVHASSILDNARRHRDLTSALAGFGRVVATTAARDRAWPRSRLVSPRELADALAQDPPGTPTALVFGPESSGLTNDELASASLLVRIPTAPEQPTLNLAQAVLIVAYELFLARKAHPAGTAAAPAGGPVAAAESRATGDELAGFFSQLETLLRRVRFARDSTIAGVERDLRQLLSRAAPTRREVTILRGILRRVGHALAGRGSRTGSTQSRRPDHRPGGG
jgi:TrmH family RNA methyltransferase